MKINDPMPVNITVCSEVNISMKIRFLFFGFVANCSDTCDYKRIGGKVCLLQRLISARNMKTCIALLHACQQGTLPQNAINKTT